MNGICYTAFGEQYDYQCAHSVAIVRRYSDIPVLVVTNADNRCSKWDELRNVSFICVDADPKENRYYKIRMDLFSPFDVTLFCDTDTAVQSAEFLSGFDTASKYDVMFSEFSAATCMEDLPAWLYRRIAKRERVKFPVVVYKEGVFFFRKTDNTRRLFEAWEACWARIKRGRDMPALFPAVANAKDLNLGVLPYGWDSRDGHIITHAHGNFKVDGLPTIQKFKPWGPCQRWTRRGDPAKVDQRPDEDC